MGRIARCVVLCFALTGWGSAAAEEAALLAGVGPVEEPVEGGSLTRFHQLIIPFRGPHHRNLFTPATPWFDASVAEHIRFLCRQSAAGRRKRAAFLDFPDGWRVGSEDSLWFYTTHGRQLVSVSDRPRLLFDEEGCQVLHAAVESTEPPLSAYGLVTSLEGEIYPPLKLASEEAIARLPAAARAWLGADQSYAHGCRPDLAWHVQQPGLEWLVTRFCDHPVDGLALEVAGFITGESTPLIPVFPRPSAGSIYLDGVFDLDLDGRMEIALHFRQHGVTEFHVLEWDGRDFLPFAP